MARTVAYMLVVSCVAVSAGCSRHVSSRRLGIGGCDDGNAATKDFLHPWLGCCHRETRDWDGPPTGPCPGSPGCDEEQPGEFAQSDNGVELDIAAQRAWSPWKYGTWSQHAAYCAGLGTSGVSWQVPTVNEARTLFSGCPPALPGGACPIADPGCLTSACGSCASCMGGALATGSTFGAGSSYLLYCKRGFRCAVVPWTSSTCSDCAAPGRAWVPGWVNGNWVAMPKDSNIAMYCFAKVGPGTDGGAPADHGVRETGPGDKSASSIGLTSALLAAESELSGTAWIHEARNRVEVQLFVKHTHGPDFSSATADIPADLFPDYIIKPPAPSVIVDVPVTQAGVSGDMSINGLTLELTTSRGEEMPYYKEGEEIRFIARMNRTANLYLFDLDSAGRACLIYPVDPDNGRLIQNNRVVVERGKPLILPEDGASYMMVASEPFGKDTVWAVASETNLKFPEKLTGDWEVSQVLVERIRAQGFAENSGYAESQVEVVTGP